MAGGGIGGVSSTGYGQPTGQSPFAGQITDTTMADAFPVSQQGNSLNQQSVAPRNVTPVLQENQTFNADWYLKQNPDVAANTYFNANPYQHYLQYGMSEGRSPFAPQIAPPVITPPPVKETPYIPVTTTFSAQQQGPKFNAPIVTQADEGAAVNYQYNRGGIASLVRR